MRRWFTLATAFVLLTTAGTAQAASIDKYRVRDVGDRILHRIWWCVERSDVRAGYETFVRWHTRIETEDGRDRRTGKAGGWYSRGCWVTRLSRPDDLRYEGWYYGRVRLTIKGYTVSTGWREFWSS